MPSEAELIQRVREQAKASSDWRLSRLGMVREVVRGALLGGPDEEAEINEGRNGGAS
jgi:hypothetical protein